MSAPRLICCANPFRRRPAAASGPRSRPSSIVTSTSASFGKDLDVASDPMSAMRRTPRQFCASNTKRSTACSNDFRGRAATPPYTSSRRGCFQGTAHTHSFAPLTAQRQNKSKYDAFGKMSQCMSQSRSPRRPAFEPLTRAPDGSRTHRADRNDRKWPILSDAGAPASRPLWDPKDGVTGRG